jgi:hypothetical protein
MHPKFEVGDLVEFKYDLLMQDLVGVVTYRYMYNKHMWYKVQWASGKQQDIAEIELKKIKTDKK